MRKAAFISARKRDLCIIKCASDPDRVFENNALSIALAFSL